MLNLASCYYTSNEFVFFLFPRWGGEGNALPQGLVYEGISDIPVEVLIACTCFMLI